MDKILGIDYCFHTHTYRCGHALGEDEEYVINLINNGYKAMGFSDHGMFRELTKEECGRDYSLLPNYIESIKNLKEKYKGIIDIKLGFEFEFDENHLDYYKELFSKYDLDYMICGQHYYFDENGKNKYYFENIDDYKAIRHYVDDVKKAIRSGLFAYIAHPDLFMNNITKITKEIEDMSLEIILEAKKYDIPLEINLGGTRFGNIVAKKRNCLEYPSKFFFELAQKYGCKLVFGLDMHAPSDARHELTIEKVKEIRSSWNIDIVNDFRIGEKDA